MPASIVRATTERLEGLATVPAAFFIKPFDDEKFLVAVQDARSQAKSNHLIDEPRQSAADIRLRSTTRPDHAKTLFGLEIVKNPHFFANKTTNTKT
jgi:hypothetical protein